MDLLEGRLDLFSMKLSSGTSLKRKKNGKIVEWKPSESIPRIPLLPVSYLEKEIIASEELTQFLQSKENKS